MYMGTPFCFEVYFLSAICYKQCMPRKARIDALGALHHVIARGIEKRDISGTTSIVIAFWKNWAQS
jgi:hypothetical protein